MADYEIVHVVYRIVGFPMNHNDVILTIRNFSEWKQHDLIVITYIVNEYRIISLILNNVTVLKDY